MKTAQTKTTRGPEPERELSSKMHATIVKKLVQQSQLDNLQLKARNAEQKKRILRMTKKLLGRRRRRRRRN
jgi:hypothetical protein